MGRRMCRPLLRPEGDAPYMESALSTQHPAFSTQHFVSVSVDALIPEYWTEWTYAVPPHLIGQVGAGQLVWVPLRNKIVLGVVTALDVAPAMQTVRDIHALVEPAFRLTARQL